jgi:hypothetical protein
MNKPTKLRKRIEEAALEMGASMDAVYKWRRRGVPHHWRVKLLSSGRRFRPQHFDQPAAQ